MRADNGSTSVDLRATCHGSTHRSNAAAHHAHITDCLAGIFDSCYTSPIQGAVYPNVD